MRLMVEGVLMLMVVRVGGRELCVGRLMQESRGHRGLVGPFYSAPLGIY
jgi:hypothetical protein